MRVSCLGKAQVFADNQELCSYYLLLSLLLLHVECAVVTCEASRASWRRVANFSLKTRASSSPPPPPPRLRLRLRLRCPLATSLRLSFVSFPFVLFLTSPIVRTLVIILHQSASPSIASCSLDHTHSLVAGGCWADDNNNLQYCACLARSVDLDPLHPLLLFCPRLLLLILLLSLLASLFSIFSTSIGTHLTLT